MLRKFFRDLVAPTPERNKKIGKTLTALAVALAGVEVYLSSTDVKAPYWLHSLVVGATATATFWALFHGSQTKINKDEN